MLKFAEVPSNSMTCSTAILLEWMHLLMVSGCTQLLQSGELEQFIEERYASHRSGIGKQIVDGTADFKQLEAYALELPEVTNQSGRQEVLETILIAI